MVSLNLLQILNRTIDGISLIIAQFYYFGIKLQLLFLLLIKYNLEDFEYPAKGYNVSISQYLIYSDPVVKVLVFCLRKPQKLRQFDIKCRGQPLKYLQRGILSSSLEFAYVF